VTLITRRIASELIRAEQPFRSESDKDDPALSSHYLYYYLHDGEGLTQVQIVEDTGFSKYAISLGLRRLKALGFIDVKKGAHGVNIVSLRKKYSTFTFADLSLLLTTNNTITGGKGGETDVHESKSDEFSEADIKMDADWKTAEPILLKYFKPYQISPVKLTTKKRFEKLCELISDKTFDFEVYCKWYRKEKYPIRKFNYGLFLYPDMIAEFRDTQEESATYLKTTTRLEDNESFKKSLKETKEFLATLEDK